MIAAGNVREEDELNKICTMAVSNLNNYIDKIRNHEGEAEMADVIKAQNYYSEHQQKNPHTPRVMQSLGLPEEDIKLFLLGQPISICFRKPTLLEIIIINIPEKGINNGRTSYKREFKTICFKSIR